MATLTVVLVVALSWIVMVHKKNAMLRVVILEKEKAQDELEKANDLLEKRVAERTAQLKVEMSARKQAEVEFKATLAERTRLAQELHDTLEQSLTGIGLQMDTAERLIDKDPASGNRHLELARNLTRQSQLELRRSIWDLRSRELEQFDFCSALKQSAQQIAEGSTLKVSVAVVGVPVPLSEVAEENLLRISQEALKNVVKHAQASRIEVTLQFEADSVTLRIRDDGKGFDPATSPGSRQGHFGLLGMAERAKRLGGSVRITSESGKGACLEAQVPAKSSSEANQPENSLPAENV
jgi:signal transduction histidine kinase